MKKTKKALSICIQSLSALLGVDETVFVGIEEGLAVGELSSWYSPSSLLFDMSLESSLGTIVHAEHLELRGLLGNWRSVLISLPDKKDFTRSP